MVLLPVYVPSSLAVPAVGAVVSMVMPLVLATVLRLPTLSLARTLMKYCVPLVRFRPVALTLVFVATLVQSRTVVPPALVPML